MKQLSLDALSHFVAVARLGGLNAAARGTGIPKATISRHLRDLEASLGVMLLERGGRKLVLTEDGRHLYDRVAPLLADIVAAGAEIGTQDGKVRGHLRVSVPSLLARFGLGAFAASFLKQHPAVTLDIDIDDHFVDPVEDGYDVVIRANPSPNSDLVGKCFLRTQGVLAAAPSITMPQDQDQLINAVALTATRDKTEWIIAQGERELRIIPKEVLCCSSMLLVYEAVLAGAGIGIVPKWLVQADIEAGRLNIWGHMPNGDISAWVLHPPSHLTSPKVTAFVGALVNAFREGHPV